LLSRALIRLRKAGLTQHPVIASLEVAHGAASPQVVADTLALGLTVMLMVGAIAVGVAAPALFVVQRRATQQQNRL
jgi:hypothetical protein